MKWISLLVIAFVFSVVIWGESLPQPSQSPKTNQTSQCNKNNSDNAPSPVYVTCSNAGENYSKSEGNKGDKESGRGASFLDIINTLATIAIAAFGGALWWTTDKMWKASKEATEIARAASVAAKDTAEAVNRNSETAEKNAEVFKERMEKQSRAYLNANFGGGIPQDRAANIRFAMQVNLFNSGHTPALHVRNKLRMGILPSPLPEHTDFALPDVWSGDGYIGPGQAFNLQQFIPDFIDDARAAILRVGNESERIYMWGVVSYEDVFGSQHTLKFCHTIHWFPNGDSWTYMTPQHNEGN